MESAQMTTLYGKYRVHKKKKSEQDIEPTDGCVSKLKGCYFLWESITLVEQSQNLTTWIVNNIRKLVSMKKLHEIALAG